jgi:hypothetical protein
MPVVGLFYLSALELVQLGSSDQFLSSCDTDGPNSGDRALSLLKQKRITEGSNHTEVEINRGASSPRRLARRTDVPTMTNHHDRR